MCYVVYTIYIIKYIVYYILYTIYLILYCIYILQIYYIYNIDCILYIYGVSVNLTERVYIKMYLLTRVDCTSFARRAAFLHCLGNLFDVAMTAVIVARRFV